MSFVGLLESGATIISGALAMIVLLGVVVDAVTAGWVRQKTRGWLGIESLRQDHHDTQTFLIDFGSAYNNFTERYATDHDLNPERRPSKVNIDYYERRLREDDEVDRGDFLTDD